MTGAAAFEAVGEWTTRLTGLPANRIGEARERIDAFDVRHLSEELTRRADIDAAAGACMLSSALEVLTERGVDETKLVAKLRRDRDVWPTVTEMIAGRAALRVFEADLEIELDSAVPDSSRNSDFRLIGHGSDSAVSVEFKALGLSKEEVAFFKRVSPLLPQLCPDQGVSTNHIAFDNPHLPHVPSRAERRSFASENRRRQKTLPPHIRDLHGAVIAAHHGEQRYLERVRDRITDALGQLSDTDDCWVALWWSNGAPASSIRQVLSTIDLPTHVLGVVLTGAGVAVPSPEVHYYDIVLPREELVPIEAEPSVHSLKGNPVGQPIYDAFACSTGVRPTLLLAPTGTRGRRQKLLSRDGNRPILPFNLLIGPDPPEMSQFVLGRGPTDRPRSESSSDHRNG
jgi:hypothetical protein